MASVLLIQPDKQVQKKWEGVLTNHDVVCVSKLDDVMDKSDLACFTVVMVDTEANFSKQVSNPLDIFFAMLRQGGHKKVCITSNKSSGPYRSDGTLNFTYYNRFCPPDANRLKF